MKKRAHSCGWRPCGESFAASGARNHANSRWRCRHGGHVHANSRGRQVRDKPGVPVCARESGHGINPCRRAAREDIEAGTACRPPAAEGSFAVSGAGRAFFRRVPGAVGKPQGQKVLFRPYRRRQQRVSAVISSVDKAQQIAMPRMHRLRKNRPSTNILIPPLRLYRAARVCASCRLPEQALLPVYARLAVLRTAIRDKRQTCPFPVQALYISCHYFIEFRISAVIESARSHLETACIVIPRCAAKSSCVLPLAFRSFFNCSFNKISILHPSKSR